MRKYLFFPSIIIFSVLFFANGQMARAACTSQQFSTQVVTRDSGSNLVPGINYAVYSETKDPNGAPYFDSRFVLTSGQTNAVGQSDVFCLDNKKYPYSVKLWETNQNYGYYSFWKDDIVSVNGILTLNAVLSDLYVAVRDAEGTLIKNSVFDVFVQGFDVDGNPIIDETKLNQDKQVLSQINTSNVGGKHLYLAEGSYAVRLKATGGTKYIYIWNQKVNKAQTASLDYKSGTLRMVIEDGNGGLMKNQPFSIYTQSYDAHNSPIVGDPVAVNLQTGPTGSADAYLPNGDYAVKIPSSVPNQFYYIWKLKIANGTLTKTTYHLSGIRVVLRDDAGEVARNSLLSVATQKKDILGNPVVDSVIVGNLNTGEEGFKDVYLPAGTYAIIYNKKKVYNLDTTDGYFTKVDWGKIVSGRLNGEVYFFSPFDNVNFSLRKTATPKINLNGFYKAISSAYKTSALTTKGGAYAVVFNYTDDQLKKAKTDPSKMRIAFYNQNSRKWQYVGKNYAGKKTAIVFTGNLGTFVLVAVK